MTVAAIHQPNLLPWLGWFDKLDRADVFVLLDQVWLNRRSTTHRVGVLHRGRALQIAVPVQHVGTQELPICEARLDPGGRRLQSVATTLRHCYGRMPHWRDVGEPVLALLLDPPERLLDLNLALIQHLLTQLGLDAGKLRLQSDLGGIGRKAELMASLTRAAGADTYLSGGHPPEAGRSGTGADYNDPAVFAEYDVALVYQSFVHPVYPQGGPFVPGLSALDALVRLGGAATLALLREARGNSQGPTPVEPPS